MSEWLKLLGGVVLAAVAAYLTLTGSVTDHGHRIDRLEHDWELHLTRHEQQYDKIDERLDAISQSLAKLAGEDGATRHPVGMSVAGKKQ